MTSSGQPSQALVPKKGIAVPVVVWLATQVLAIALSATRIPLWANAPRATELFALQYVLIAQLAASSLIFPWLMRSRGEAAAVIATAWPMIFFAGLLSPAPVSTLVIAGIYISGWLLALAFLRPPLFTAGPSFASPLVVLWTGGGLLLQFLNLEYGNAPLKDGLLQRLLQGPIVAGIRLVHGEIAVAAEVLGLVLVVSVVLFLKNQVAAAWDPSGKIGKP
jgi:hypothetical protein